MNTSEYNASLQPGEKPIGSGVGSSKPAESSIPAGKQMTYAEHMSSQDKRRNDAALVEKFRRIDEIFENRRVERLAHERAMELHRQDRARIEAAKERSHEPRDRSLDESPQDKRARESAKPAAKTPEAKKPSGQESAALDTLNRELMGDEGLAYKDEWDLPPDQRSQPATETPDGFDRYRQQPYRGHAIEAQSVLTNNTRVGADEISAAAVDLGIAARRDGVSQEAAQTFFDMIGQDYTRPVGEGFDEHTGRMALYAACGEHVEEVIYDIQGWVAKRPAIAALLDDGPGYGNHPGVLLTLGGIAHAAKSGLDITKPSDAKVYVERVLNDPKSEYWTDGPRHKLIVRGVQFAMGVAESRKK